jgi:hypothetical protein
VLENKAQVPVFGVVTTASPEVTLQRNPAQQMGRGRERGAQNWMEKKGKDKSKEGPFFESR